MADTAGLAVGLAWICTPCRTQGSVVHHTVDAARHDAAGHALDVHQDTYALTGMRLHLVTPEEGRLRRARYTKDAVQLIPRLEDPFETGGELSDLQLDLACRALGCPEDARHRRRRRQTPDGAGTATS